MNSRNALLACLTLGVLLSGGHALAQSYAQDFAITYEIDPATGEVRHRLVGTYSAAIECSASWARRDLLRDSIDMPIIEPVSMRNPNMTTAAATHTLRYSVSLTQGMLRVIETKNGTRVADFLFSCPSPRPNAGPALHPTEGEQSATFRAVSLQSACATTAEAGAPGLAPRENDVKGSARQYSVESDDSGLCLALGYQGMLPGPSCLDPAKCVPFSGRLQASVSADDPATSGLDVMVSGIACSFMVVGGYCWNGNLSGDTQGGPTSVDDPVWNPCDCAGSIAAAVYTPSDETGTGTPMTSAVGGWSTRVFRAP